MNHSGFLIVGMIFLLTGLLFVADGYVAYASPPPKSSTSSTGGTTTTTTMTTNPVTIISASDQNGNSLTVPVTVDGNYGGVTPTNAYLSQGAHTVSCAALPGYTSLKTSFTVQGGQYSSIVCSYSLTQSSSTTTVTTTTVIGGTTTTTTSGTVTYTTIQGGTTSTTTVVQSTTTVSAGSPVTLIVNTVTCTVSCSPYSNGVIQVFTSPSSTIVLCSSNITNGVATLHCPSNQGVVTVDWIGCNLGGTGCMIVGQTTVPLGLVSPVTTTMTGDFSYLSVVGLSILGNATGGQVTPIGEMGIGAFLAIVGGVAAVMGREQEGT